MTTPRQTPGALPRGCDLDSLLTPEQFAVWRQISVDTARAHIRAGHAPAIKHSREDIRIHPRSYLDSFLKRKPVIR